VILVVDDEEDMLAVVRRILAPLKVEVRLVSEPREALAALARMDDVSVILSDADMPQVDGSELLERARQLRPSAVRMMMTGRGSYETAIRAINSGEVHRYIRKPFEADELRDAVRSAIARHEEVVRSASGAGQRARERALEERHPGITRFSRDQTGAYAIDATRYLRAERFLASLGIVRDRH
jgi:DNA-binding NtrC family response regulator